MALEEHIYGQQTARSKQIEQQEILYLRELKKEAFRLALQVKPINYSSGLSQQKINYEVSNLISDANKIYEELIK